MPKLLNLKWGVADDPAALQPGLSECLESVVAQSGVLVDRVVEGLVLASAPQGPRRHPQLQGAAARDAVERLQRELPGLREGFRHELGRLVFEGGGKEQLPREGLRFEDLQLLDDALLDRNIEQARALQEVERMVDDVLPPLDALVSTLLGWRSTQPGLNPVRPEVFVRALQASFESRVHDAAVREALLVPAAGLLGAQLRLVYREMGDWLASTGIEPAVPVGGRKDGGAAASVSRSVARTLVTLDRLRKLLAGDFDAQASAARADFLHTVPASMALLQEMKKEDELLRRLEQEQVQRTEPAAPQDLLLSTAAPAAEPLRIGRQLGEQVVRLMFENLAQEGRLVDAYKAQLRAMEPVVARLAQGDSRFFSDRGHPARQLLDRMTQRSLAFSAESDEGWQLFLASIEATVRRLGAGAADADAFEQALGQLQALWDGQDQRARQKREEVARALVHAEQRNLLAQRLAEQFEQTLAGRGVPDFVADFLRTAWTQAVAEDQLRSVDGSDDPRGLRAAVEDLVWSVEAAKARGGRLQRLALLVPGLLARLRDGLRLIDYPPELAERFFDRLHAIHASALKDGRDAGVRRAAREAEAASSEFGPSAFEEDAGVWLASREIAESGFVASQAHPSDVLEELVPASPDALAIGAWVELRAHGQWQRVQLTWASPHQTLFMFTSPKGTAHSMSRRSLERLQAGGRIRLVAARPLLDEALDQVARAALRNSIDPG
ncbi:DUF1631 family protein [Ramlibacter rhizophilus]|uniref:DUF1631 family protein n=1 Tax=Ramlibacter rhizophilus TaxID=1781167 RepID=A0A4Z0BC29_9BURK|nr:DUF1631 family protein [Ramlibacter rhizophilus]TFY96776.1 DUF1631 family protein [Ramlibacter rhizophilus]